MESAAEIFVNSMSYPFHHHIPLEYIELVFATLRAASWHQFQLLTERSSRLLACSGEIDWPSNAWIMDSDWVKSIRNQCAEAEVAFFFKQLRCFLAGFSHEIYFGLNDLDRSHSPPY